MPGHGSTPLNSNRDLAGFTLELFFRNSQMLLLTGDSTSCPCLTIRVDKTQQKSKKHLLLIDYNYRL